MRKPKAATKAYKGVDAETRRWIRNASDEQAAADGCRFDGERGEFVIDWIERYCRLYEGEWAGQPMQMGDWQRDVIMRVFSWVRFSEDWQRDVRRFKRGSVWIAKKNGKSPTLAAIGLYLFAGDGEAGQKIYSVAKDGKQAMISHAHAMNMVKLSPTLMEECKINLTTGDITHLPTMSKYKIVAGDNPQSQEGLNGSIMVDETHVVDRRLMSVLRFAGASRSEPLHLEFSTAGKNPDSYGKEQFDRGMEIESGRLRDDSYFFLSFAAPQDLSDKELDKHPAKYGKLANPTWGRIIMPGEFLGEYQTCKRSLSDLADFKMYRLNVWQRSASPWLRESDWAQCKQDFSEADLGGQACWAGLDMSKTQDMTALVLVFRSEDSGFRVLPYFWLPEETARNNAHLANFLQWSGDGHLRLTPGQVIDYGIVESDIRRILSRFVVRGLAYDLHYADELTKRLCEGSTDGAGNMLAEGLGIERVIFKQTIMQFAGPTAEVERLVLDHKFHHNGHPVLSWQAGHVEVYRDANNNKRPIKPKGGDVRKIDGIVSAIMAVGLATSGESTEIISYYVM